MFITEIVTYGIEAGEFERKYSDEISDIKATLEQLSRESIGKSRPKRGPMRDNDNDDVTTWKMKYFWEELIQERGWNESRSYVEGFAGRRFHMRMLGNLKGRVSCTFSTHRDHLNRWLYTYTPMAFKNGLVDLPIMLLPTMQVYEDYFDRRMVGMREDFERIVDELIELSPLSHSHPFVLIGVSTQSSLITIKTIDSEKGIDQEKIILDKSIEFPPEFRQAGLGILNYFGEVVREKCPDEKAKIRIEQDGSKVRLIIEGEDGSREIIEKALQEYELVVTGQRPPESIFDDKAKVLELKNELRIAQARIESQKDIIEYQREAIKEIRQLFNRALLSSTAKDINLTVAPNIKISTSQSSSINVFCKLSDALADIENLITAGASDPKMVLRLNDLYEAVENLDENSGAESIRSSSGLGKLRRFLNEAAEAGSEVSKFLDKVSDGVEIVKSLARKYNSIAEWCGAPQIPKILTR